LRQAYDYWQDQPGSPNISATDRAEAQTTDQIKAASQATASKNRAQSELGHI